MNEKEVLADAIETVEPDEPRPAQMTLDDLAAHYQDGLATIRAVLEALPQSQARNNAAIFMDTATLWVQQVFQEQQMRQAHLQRQMQKRKAKQ